MNFASFARPAVISPSSETTVISFHAIISQIPGIECLLARGHTVGLQAVAVCTAKGTAVLGSDCAHVFRNYREDWPSALITDLVAWMKTYDKLKRRASYMDLIFPGQDPTMTSDYPAVAEDVTRLV